MLTPTETAYNYINRELSLLAFQRRVLEEVADEKNPLLERVKFLAIIGSNLEEFFMVRVGGLTLANDSANLEFDLSGMSPAEQLDAIRQVVQGLLADTQEYWTHTLLPALDLAGIHILDYDQLDPAQRAAADHYFREAIFPVLTPLAFDTGHPFPHISNLSLNFAILLKGSPQGTAAGEENQRHFARLKIPSNLPYIAPVVPPAGAEPKPGSLPAYYFVWLSQIIRANLELLFPGMEVVDAHPFHVTRNAEFEMQEFEAEDLLETMEESVRQRRFGAVVRLLVRKDMPTYLLDILAENLKVDANAIYATTGPLVLRSLMQLYRIDRPDLKYRPFIPHVPAAFMAGEVENSLDIFAAIRAGDTLLHHPYDSFAPVVNFLNAAARDPDVLAIKQTLYRVGADSPVVKALLEASREYGKQVAVLVELKARFDEESNINWARMLEDEGVHVTYGMLGLKTHSKIALVVRKEGEHIRRYVHLATGNYNHVTAQLYEDFGMFTCDPEIGADATDLFNYLTGYSLKEDYRKLLVAPLNMRARFEELIRREIEHQNNGQAGYLIFKFNHLVDQPIISLLYEASRAGVQIDLIVRGICALRPGVKGLSENIRVTSILGRFLEHSRIYYFRNGGEEVIYLGSADLMQRNLNQRVEVIFPVQDVHLVRFIRDNVLDIYRADNVKARMMQPDGTYIRLAPGSSAPLNAQEWFIAQTR